MEPSAGDEFEPQTCTVLYFWSIRQCCRTVHRLVMCWILSTQRCLFHAKKMKHKICIFNFNAALICHVCALWCCFTMKTFPHMHACIILQSANPQAPPALSQGVISGNYLVSQGKA